MYVIEMPGSRSLHGGLISPHPCSANAFPEGGDAQAGDGPVEYCEVNDSLERDAGDDSEAAKGRKKEHVDLVRDSTCSGETGCYCNPP